MSIWIVGSVLLVLLIYIVATINFIHNNEKHKEIEVLMDTKKETIKVTNWERKMLKMIDLDLEKARSLLFFERFLLVAGMVVIFYFLKGLAIAAVGAIIVTIAFDDAYKKVIYESGIDNINKVTNFINYFVPHINSGNSADQSFLGYIEYSKDEELANYYENRENPDYKLPVHLKQIVDIYDIAKYNENLGVSDYTYIMNELSQDMAQKQVYYNSFVSRIGEIKPIMWSYYIGVPLLIIISFSQTKSFWLAGGGYIVSLILLVLFALFKFLIYSLQKKTVNTIF